jgi:hypothetical protein
MPASKSPVARSMSQDVTQIAPKLELLKRGAAHLRIASLSLRVW